MGLTGSATFVVVALLTVAVPVACLVLWNRLGARAWVRVSVRAAMLVTGQFLAVLLVALMVNNYYGFYTSWSEVFGKPDLRSTSSPVISHRVDKTLAGTLRRAYHGGHGTVPRGSSPDRPVISRRNGRLSISRPRMATPRCPAPCFRSWNCWTGCRRVPRPGPDRSR